MISIDTNILVYAHRSDGPFHEQAREAVRRCAEGSAAWAVPWPCVHEFMSIVTNPRIFKQPTPIKRAVAQAAAWLASPSVTLLTEGEGYWEVLADLLARSEVHGAKVHDARIAALCLYHRVRELWTADRDFNRFPGVAIKNPLVGQSPRK